MTTQTVPETIGPITGTIESATYKPGEGERAASRFLKAKLPGFGNFATPMYVPADWGTEASLAAGTSHVFNLKRGNLKEGKSGSYKSDFFWTVTRMDSFGEMSELPLPKAVPPAAVKDNIQGPGVAYDAKGQQVSADWVGMFASQRDADQHQRIAWGQAINCAIQIMGPHLDGMNAEAYLNANGPSVLWWANLIYPLILNGPGALQKASPVTQAAQPIQTTAAPENAPTELQARANALISAGAALTGNPIMPSAAEVAAFAAWVTSVGKRGEDVVKGLGMSRGEWHTSGRTLAEAEMALRAKWGIQ